MYNIKKNKQGYYIEDGWHGCYENGKRVGRWENRISLLHSFITIDYYEKIFIIKYYLNGNLDNKEVFTYPRKIIYQEFYVNGCLYKYLHKDNEIYPMEIPQIYGVTIRYKKYNIFYEDNIKNVMLEYDNKGRVIKVIHQNNEIEIIGEVRYNDNGEIIYYKDYLGNDYHESMKCNCFFNIEQLYDTIIRTSLEDEPEFKHLFSRFSHFKQLASKYEQIQF